MVALSSFHLPLKYPRLGCKVLPSFSRGSVQIQTEDCPARGPATFKGTYSTVGAIKTISLTRYELRSTCHTSVPILELHRMNYPLGRQKCATPGNPVPDALSM